MLLERFWRRVILVLSMIILALLIGSCSDDSSSVQVETVLPPPDHAVPAFVIEDCKLALDSISHVYFREFSQHRYYGLSMESFLNLTYRNDSNQTRRKIILSSMITGYWAFDYILDSTYNIQQYFAIYRPGLLDNTFSAIYRDNDTSRFTYINLPSILPTPLEGSTQYFVQQGISVIHETLNAFGRYQYVYFYEPPSIEVLLTRGFLTSNDIHLGNWEFDLIGANPTTVIKVVSTSANPLGEGKFIGWNAVRGFLFGYGI